MEVKVLRPFDSLCLFDLVIDVEGIGGGPGGDITDGVGGHDRGHILLLLALAVDGRRRRNHAPRGGAGALHAGIHVSLVVVADKDKIIAPLAGPGERLDADIAGPSVSGPGSHGDPLLALDLERADNAGCRSSGGGKGDIQAGQLGGGNQIEPLQNREAARRHDQDGIPAQGLEAEAV